MPKSKRSESDKEPDRMCTAAMLCFVHSPVLSVIASEVRDIILSSGSADYTLNSPEYPPAAWQGYVSDRTVTACSPALSAWRGWRVGGGCLASLLIIRQRCPCPPRLFRHTHCRELRVLCTEADQERRRYSAGCAGMGR